MTTSQFPRDVNPSNQITVNLLNGKNYMEWSYLAIEAIGRQKYSDT